MLLELGASEENAQGLAFSQGVGAREDAEDRKEAWLWRTEPFAEASCQILKQ